MTINMKNIKSLKPNKLMRNQHGTSLVEVLVAVLILGVGLLGIAAMQAVTLRNGQSSLERSQAVMHGYGILDAMRANVINARANSYNIGRTCAVPTATGTLAQRDLNAWLAGIQNNLGPTACGTIACNTNICDITVDWLDSRGTGGSTTVPLQITMRSRI
jgi:type IV pilus assembly protein PilV